MHILLPLTISLVLETIIDHTPKTGVQEATLTVFLLPHLHLLKEFCFYSGLIGVALLMIEHLLKEGPIFDELEKVLRNVIPLANSSKYDNHANASLLYEQLLKENIKLKWLSTDLSTDKNDELQKAKNELASGNVSDAIQRLDTLSKVHPEYKSDLLTALIASTELKDWERAETLLEEHGKPIDYTRLAYKRWANGNMEKAALLAQKAYDSALALPKTNPTTKTVFAKTQNNLAYFSADIHYNDKSLKDKAAEIIRLAEDGAILAKELEGEESKLYAQHLDTRGYTKIVFGKDKKDVYDGIADCELARKRGTDEAFYLKHTSRALERLKVL